MPDSNSSWKAACRLLAGTVAGAALVGVLVWAFEIVGYIREVNVENLVRPTGVIDRAQEFAGYGLLLGVLFVVVAALFGPHISILPVLQRLPRWRYLDRKQWFPVAFLITVANRAGAAIENYLPAADRRLDRAQRFSVRHAARIWLFVGLILIPGLTLIQEMNVETVNMLGRYLAYAVVAVGMDLIWGYTGILGLCQSLFFALGGYALGMHMALHGPLDGEGIPRALYVVSSDVSGFQLPVFWHPFRPLVLALILGLLIPGIVAFVIGFFGFISRVRGVYFAILTQAITLAAWMVFCRNDIRLCGTNGLTNFEVLAGMDLEEPNVKLALYVVTLVVLVGVFLLCRYLVRSRFGRILIAIRDNEARVRFCGYKPQYYKLFAFTLAGVIAGIGGMLYVPQITTFTPTYMEVFPSIFIVVWVAVGGRGTLSGAILGALVVNLAYTYFTSSRPLFWGLVRWNPDYWPFVLGGLAIVVVLFFPNGLMGLWHRLTARQGQPVGLEMQAVPPGAAGKTGESSPEAGS